MKCIACNADLTNQEARYGDISGNYECLPCRKKRTQLSQEADEAIAAFLTTLAEGKVCPHCQQPIADKKQIGRCVYALPCYHRLYQGQLPTTEKRERKEHPFLKEQREREAQS